MQARTSFDVLGAKIPQEEGAMIVGYVWSTGYTYNRDTGQTNTIYSPVPDALVDISTVVNPAAVWSGKSDSDGRFVVRSDPGTLGFFAVKYFDYGGPIIPDVMPPTGYCRVKVEEGEVSRPIIALSSEYNPTKVRSVRKVSVQRVSDNPDYLLVEVEVFGRKSGTPTLLATHITSGGVLKLEAIQRAEPPPPYWQSSEEVFRTGVLLPNVPGMYKVHVQAQENAREATVGKPAD